MDQDIELHQTGVQLHPSESASLLQRKVPKPSYRHAAPAGPWPYVDSLDEQDDVDIIDSGELPIIGSCGHDDCDDCPQWYSYPQRDFGNWTIKPVRKCGIEGAVRNKDHTSTIYAVNVHENGDFKEDKKSDITPKNKREYWNDVLKAERKPGIRVRALFVDKISGPVLQMLGHRYTIEPFFFSSSINWIPSRYQENPLEKKGDHITVTLTFVRSARLDQAALESAQESAHPTLLAALPKFRNQFQEIENIDTQAPLQLRSMKKVLLLDLLAIHMVRDVNNSTIITYHPTIEGSTSAEELFTRLKLVGRSVYWQIIVQKTKDPTFMFLALLWNALYAWDEALEELYAHFCWLESRVIVTNDLVLTYELHVIRAHLLHYTGLLEDFKKAVEFVRDTHNPAMDNDSISDEQRSTDQALLKDECQHLLTEIERLLMHRQMQDDRVQNVTHLVYAMVNIEDSRAMKRLSYITMIFLPGSFMAGVFGMNVMELNAGTYGTIPHYVETTLPLTLFTIWIIVAFQGRFVLRENEAMWKKLLWPIVLVQRLLSRPRRQGYSQETAV